MLKTYFYKLLSFTNNISIKLGAILAGFFSPIQGIIFLCMIPTLTTTAGKVDLITLIWDGTDYFGVASTNF